VRADGRRTPGAKSEGIVVEPRHAGARLDRTVRELFGLTWSVARRRIAEGKVRVDGAPVTEPGTQVRHGHVISMNMATRRARPATDLPPGAVVYVDDHVVVVNKPAGITTIPFVEREKGTLDERVRARIARMPDARKEPGRGPLGIVHRIDRGTSGLVVFTRTLRAKNGLAAQFREHSVHRLYLAVALGRVEDGTITSHIVADRGDGRRGSIEAASPRLRRGLGRGKVAITHVRVVERLEGATLVSCRLETGRTHQIRIHLAESGHPLVGERIYGRKEAEGPVASAGRPMLHAAELGFTHPATGSWMQFSRPLPDDMQGLVERLRR
jgi:23S rRNA pseudouridine1911/1915/1917 synthase